MMGTNKKESPMTVGTPVATKSISARNVFDQNEKLDEAKAKTLIGIRESIRM